MITQTFLRLLDNPSYWESERIFFHLGLKFEKKKGRIEELELDSLHFIYLQSVKFEKESKIKKHIHILKMTVLPSY